MKASQKVMSVLVTFGTASLMWGCGTAQQASHIDVTNGRPISEKTFPAVISLSVEHDGREGICSGTFISDHIVLTAAHCVSDGHMADPSAETTFNVSMVKFEGSDNSHPILLAKSEATYQHPEWTGNGVGPKDLGIVIFPKGTAPAVANIRTAAPKAGEDIEIVGYGINDTRVGRDTISAGIKREGHNKLKEVKDGMLMFEGSPINVDASGTNSASGGGDSGGPLFIDGQLAGTTSGGGVRDGSKVSFYVDLTTPSSRQFLKKLTQL